jgi:hypothetical protein
MVNTERSVPADDEQRRMRERYNRLCFVLTRYGTRDQASFERLLGELQQVTERILATEELTKSSRDASGRTEARATPTPESAPAADARARPAGGNVVAFRLKMRGTPPENGQLSSEVIRMLRGASAEPHAGTPKAPVERKPDEQRAPQPDPQALRSYTAKLGSEIERLARLCDDHGQRLDRIEQQIRQLAPMDRLADEIASLRDTATRQREQLTTLATAVHRLATLLVPGSH